jgi:hypothetical protein
MTVYSGLLTYSGAASGYDSITGTISINLTIGSEEVDGYATVQYAGSGISGGVPFSDSGSGSDDDGSSATSYLGTSSGIEVIIDFNVGNEEQGSFAFNGTFNNTQSTISGTTEIVNYDDGVTAQFSTMLYAQPALPPIISFNTGSLQVNASAGVATYTLTRGPVPLGDIGSSIDISTVDGTAIAGRDYDAINDMLVVFGPGQTTSAPITVSIFPDSSDATGGINPDFEVILSNPINASIGFGTADTTIIEAVSKTPDDFYGSGTSDLLFQNTSGDFAIWQTNGSAVIGGGNVGSPGSGWTEIGTGMFNTGNQSDVLFKSSTGNYALWDMNGTAVTDVATFGSPGSGWNFVDIGNFDGTGNGDILFQNTAGIYAMWETNGRSVIGGGNIGSPGTGWSEVGVGDFNTGSKSDVLFESSTGSYALWDMNGTAVANVVTLGSPGAGWTFEGIGNFDGTGGDILFENTAGDYAIWETNGASVVGGGNLGSPGPGWSFAAIGDYNGDGKSDILFQNSSGGSTAYAAWEMNGATLASVATFGTPGSGWTLQHTG